MSDNYDFCIAVRIYPKISKRTFIQFTDKYDLLHSSMKSLRGAIGTSKVHIIFILDSCGNEYKLLLNEIFQGLSFQISEYQQLGNAGSFELQISELLKQSLSENVFFCEDDYLFLPNTFHKIKEFSSVQNHNFIITPFDHPDLYRHPIHSHKKKNYHFQNTQWQEINSTCLTFFTTKTSLLNARSILLTYSKKNSDTAIFWILTKHCLKPATLLMTVKQLLRKDFFPLKVLIKSFMFGFPFLLTESRFKLFAPVPSFATHLDSNDRAQNIDWERFI